MSKKHVVLPDGSFIEAVTPLPLDPLGSHVSNTTLSSAQTITAPALARSLIVQALGQNVRYTIDGTTVPTATSGFQLDRGSTATIQVSPGMVFKFIEEGPTASLQYQWSK